jgi:hypothetical protein
MPTASGQKIKSVKYRQETESKKQLDSALRMASVLASETLVDFHQTARHYYPE